MDLFIWTVSFLVHGVIALAAGWYYASARELKNTNRYLEELRVKNTKRILELEMQVFDGNRSRNPFPAPAIPRSWSRSLDAASGSGYNGTDAHPQV